MLTEKQLYSLKKELATKKDYFPVLFSALSDQTRFGIFKLLLKHEELCVTEVSMVFSVSVPAASQHLKILENAGLVDRERYGQTICYKVRKKEKLVKSIIEMLKNKPSLY